MPQVGEAERDGCPDSYTKLGILAILSSLTPREPHLGDR
jgi:hypothetical protein